MCGDLGRTSGSAATAMPPDGVAPSYAASASASNPSAVCRFRLGAWRLGGALRAAFHAWGIGAGRHELSATATRIGWRAELLGCRKVVDAGALCGGGFVTSDTPLGGPALVELGVRAMVF
jgi:hypothetical protein